MDKYNWLWFCLDCLKRLLMQILAVIAPFVVIYFLIAVIKFLGGGS